MKRVLTVALLLSLVVLVPSSTKALEAPTPKALPAPGDTANPPASPDLDRFLASLRGQQPTLASVCGDCWAIGWTCCYPQTSHPYCVNPDDGEACGGPIFP